MFKVESPIAGKVFEILIQVGQAVTDDDELMIIEAMKMENPVFSDESGTVKEILVAVGDRVDEGHVLAIIE
ncbi:MAG: acetyl-CoA carboxylase biotin carboxyl carrier protein subunit [Syntrophomonadaceae bacterium]|nr:acetyl-CoA carboxylase biotin carboxyl carrier protein subunit [Syntrophomonadaceae bacterium]